MDSFARVWQFRSTSILSFCLFCLPLCRSCCFAITPARMKTSWEGIYILFVVHTFCWWEECHDRPSNPLAWARLYPAMDRYSLISSSYSRYSGHYHNFGQPESKCSDGLFILWHMSSCNDTANVHKLCSYFKDKNSYQQNCKQKHDHQFVIYTDSSDFHPLTHHLVPSMLSQASPRFQNWETHPNSTPSSSPMYTDFHHKHHSHYWSHDTHSKSRSRQER